MYPARIDFQNVIERIEALLRNGHHAEALVTSMFTMEKLIRRSLRIAIVARGFSQDQANIIFGRNGFDDLEKKWPVFDRYHRDLHTVLDADWQSVVEAKKMRNNFVHGHSVYDLAECEKRAKQVVAALGRLHSRIKQDYEHDPWGFIPCPKAVLQWQL
jgi:hypothetical protein